MISPNSPGAYSNKEICIQKIYDIYPKSKKVLTAAWMNHSFSERRNLINLRKKITNFTYLSKRCSYTLSEKKKNIIFSKKTVFYNYLSENLIFRTKYFLYLSEKLIPYTCPKKGASFQRCFVYGCTISCVVKT